MDNIVKQITEKKYEQASNSITKRLTEISAAKLHEMKKMVAAKLATKDE